MLKTHDLKTARLLKLADYIERGTGEFNMRNWCHCVAGHVARMLGHPMMASDSSIKEIAADWLDLEPFEAMQLFCPVEPPSALSVQIGARNTIRSDITRGEAARCLRHYAITGDIDWEKACG